jgi:hypothetical protein
MDNKTIFNFTDHASSIPLLTETADKYNGWYRIGADNQYYTFLTNLYKNSSNTSSMLDNIVARIVGTGFQSDNEVDKALIDKYELNTKWLPSVAKDLCLCGGYGTDITWNMLHEKINKFNHVPVNNIRVGLMTDDETEPTLFYLSSQFSQYTYNGRNKSIEVRYTFSDDPITDAKQMLYNFGLNRVGNDVYGTPDWARGGVAWATIDAEIPRYYVNLIKNNFMVNTIIVVPVMPVEEEREAFEEGLKNKFTGTGQGGSTMIIYSPSDASEVKVLSLGGLDAERKYNELSDLTIESLSRAFRLPSPMLAGLAISGSLFGITDMPQLENMLNKATIYPKRATIKADFDLINKYLAQPITQYTIGDNNVFNQATN